MIYWVLIVYTVSGGVAEIEMPERHGLAGGWTCEAMAEQIEKSRVGVSAACVHTYIPLLAYEQSEWDRVRWEGIDRLPDGFRPLDTD